jgi:hypothetical protein
LANYDTPERYACPTPAKKKAGQKPKKKWVTT